MRSRAILARNMKRLRAVRRLSQEALAYEANIDRTYVSDLEREQYAASLDMLDDIAKALDVRPSDLIDDEYDPEGRFGD
jgi:transcriptional regulator with XRE-family HTH domain